MNNIKVVKGNRSYSLTSIMDLVKMIINNNPSVQGALQVEDIPDSMLRQTTEGGLYA